MEVFLVVIVAVLTVLLVFWETIESNLILGNTLFLQGSASVGRPCYINARELEELESIIRQVQGLSQSQNVPRTLQCHIRGRIMSIQMEWSKLDLPSQKRLECKKSQILRSACALGIDLRHWN